MSAFLIASVTVKNLDWVAEYVVKVPPIVRSHGGEFLAVTNNGPNAVELVEGTAPPPDGFTIISFPSMGAVKAFLADPLYAPYKKARSEGTESNFWAFENNEDAPQLLEGARLAAALTEGQSSAQQAPQRDGSPLDQLTLTPQRSALSVTLLS